MEYRAIDGDDFEPYYRIVRYAFDPAAGPLRTYREDEVPNWRRYGAHRGLYPDTTSNEVEPKSVCRHYWFDVSVRGHRCPASGLASMATPPEHRRQGYARRLLERSLEEYDERGVYFAFLWPFDSGFYRKFGWQHVHDISKTTLTQSAIHHALADQSSDSTVLGQWAELDRNFLDDIDPLRTCYRRHADRYSLWMYRKPEWWKHFVFSSLGTDRFVYGRFLEDELVGYIAFTVSTDSDQSDLTVSDFAFTDDSGLVALLEFCRNFDSQVDTVTVHGPSPFDQFDSITRNVEVDRHTVDGPMVRIVDVESVLTRVRSDSDADDVVLEVSDDVLPRNDDRFKLSNEHDPSGCIRTDDPPDVRIDIGSLTRLVVGSDSPMELATNGLIDIDDAVMDHLERWFPSEALYFRDKF